MLISPLIGLCLAVEFEATAADSDVTLLERRFSALVFVYSRTW